MFLVEVLDEIGNEVQIAQENRKGVMAWEHDEKRFTGQNKYGVCERRRENLLKEGWSKHVDKSESQIIACTYTVISAE